jgi:hypothetical protein
MEWADKTYHEYQSFIAEVYTKYVTRKELQLQVISDKVRDLCEFVRDHRKFILRIQPSMEKREKDYLVIHAMRFDGIRARHQHAAQVFLSTSR